ncbi:MULTISPECIES: DivIVA domain-containing protein [unclassified Arthrobacter]|uniref:DivIVA domain-containing protein n=1 Tax=unclassified Arthrobacter TaxID=235627 RepID=UPI001D135D50|nr:MULTISPECIES: DivIVA domain-containing protein [unclassified Arthrobacter]MCC3277039.1 DivIVA domain-containing protein [Arthrobacter sp. zg-Y20]MCC3280634.1 DivIVA domain-containing protein [Arthrobacter sp. zg-Y40]MCC9178889.1 DivIVA domain-containing protein [Arthrobacter sp. zg-Y750]MDK1317200.1 DivIVA domain-containing protein [Arthrobacter sp. zg.Y20]MDK1328934.1 DivIVA domain-containing protein [Arthrobacter sp. zg-Y1143]
MDDARQASAPFERVGRRDFGYNIRQVDEFLTKARNYYNSDSKASNPVTSADVRSMAFDPAKGGYEPQAVDAALDRLEDVFAQRERDQLIEDRGEEAWLLQIGRISAVLRARLHRKPGERFRRPARKRVASYNVKDVDALCNELLGYFEHDRPLSVDVVRRAVFRETKGDQGYEETQVDAFLDRVVELMASID